MHDLAHFCCQDPDCSLYGRRDAGNLSVCGRLGKHKQSRQLWFIRILRTWGWSSRWTIDQSGNTARPNCHRTERPTVGPLATEGTSPLMDH
jgi:hypothetical protein